jgi:hypothetical protein
MRISPRRLFAPTAQSPDVRYANAAIAPYNLVIDRVPGDNSREAK